MDYNLWMSNIERVLKEVPGSRFGIMSTYNALSIISYKEFLKDILRLKTEYYKEEYNFSPVVLDIPYLRHPFHQTIFVLTKDFNPYIEDQLTFMYQNLENKNWKKTRFMGFFEYEATNLKRIHELAISYHSNPLPNDATKNQKDFSIFFDEHDRRRGTNFLETFPEMSDFKSYCKQL
jgi:hypothetical protein